MDLLHALHPAALQLAVPSSSGGHAAVKNALGLGAIGLDAVKHLVLCRVEKRPPKLDLDDYPYLPRAKVGTTSAVRDGVRQTFGAVSARSVRSG